MEWIVKGLLELLMVAVAVLKEGLVLPLEVEEVVRDLKVCAKLVLVVSCLEAEALVLMRCQSWSAKPALIAPSD